jgi:plastocyanin
MARCAQTIAEHVRPTVPQSVPWADAEKQDLCKARRTFPAVGERSTATTADKEVVMYTRLAVAVAGFVALAALGSAAAADLAVTITRTGYVPRDVTVAAGSSVTWTNSDTTVHQVVFDKTPCNLTIQPAARASCTFPAGGRFTYRDPSQGGNFRGTVTVNGPKTAVTLTSSRQTATFAAPVTLTGVASNQQAGEKVTISAQECGKTAFARVNDATTTAGGNWTLAVKPTIKTVYRARWRTTDSPTATVNVRPALRLSRVRTRFDARLTAAQAFTGKLVLFQRYRPTVKRWATLKRVTFGAAATPSAGTVVTSARFRSRVRKGWRLRLFLPQAQAGACYLAVPSNTLRIR